MKKIAVIGTGAWGTALAIHAANAGLDVSLLGRRTEIVDRLVATRQHPALPGAPPIPDRVLPTTDPFALKDGDNTLRSAFCKRAIGAFHWSRRGSVGRPRRICSKSGRNCLRCG